MPNSFSFVAIFSLVAPSVQCAYSLPMYFQDLGFLSSRSRALVAKIGRERSGRIVQAPGLPPGDCDSASTDDVCAVVTDNVRHDRCPISNEAPQRRPQSINRCRSDGVRIPAVLCSFADLPIEVATHLAARSVFPPGMAGSSFSTNTPLHSRMVLEASPINQAGLRGYHRVLQRTLAHCGIIFGGGICATRSTNIFYYGLQRQQQVAGSTTGQGEEHPALHLFMSLCLRCAEVAFYLVMTPVLAIG